VPKAAADHLGRRLLARPIRSCGHELGSEVFAADQPCIAARLVGDLEPDCVGNCLLVVREDEEPGLPLLAWYVDGSEP
jgi:hypothetical protein